MSRVLEGPTFARSPGLSKLLRYLVEETLAGRADRLKEYTLGVDVFQRGSAFNPKADTIVRVQARRLRAKLAVYYSREGAADEVVIEVPIGGYVPNFRKRVSRRPPPARLRHTYTIDGDLPFTSGYQPDPKAHRLYVDGSRLSSLGNPEDLQAAIRHFEESIAIDPNYALSFAGLSDAYLQLSSTRLPPHDAMDKAREAAEKAIELDPGLDKAHAALGHVHLRYDWDRKAAKDRVKIAMALNPKSAEAHILYATTVTSEGRLEEALSHTRRAQEIDPYSVKARIQAQFAYLFLRDYEAAIEEGLKTLQLANGFSLGRALLGLAYAFHGDVSEGLGHLRRAHDEEDGPWEILFLQHGYALAGEEKQAMQLIRQLEEMARTQYMCAYEIGQAYAVMENQDGAFRWLDAALEERSDCMVFLEVEPWMDCLRSDERYEGVVNRLLHQPACPVAASNRWEVTTVPSR